jgi:hypothetical protein
MFVVSLILWHCAVTAPCASRVCCTFYALPCWSGGAGPSNVELLSAGTRTKTNQYSVTEYDTVVHKGEMQMPSVWFSYDISPISVTISETRKSFAHLLTRFCAVVGGVFAVTGDPWARHHASINVPVLDLPLQL